MHYLVTGGTAMHGAMATTEAEIGYTSHVTRAEGVRHAINALRQKHGLPGAWV
jgi:hypothetical protein